MKFLVVDDSKVSRKKLSKFIDELGYELIGEAKDGLEGFTLAEKLNPDFIIMDLEMPNMNGIESTKKIISLNKNIDIIIVTSIVDKKELISALKYGAKKILQKPISLEDLKQSIFELKNRG